ncbi:F0F1 ATP synthase subunit epsilon [Roseisalinus antarcticus]|uniref:ATP synthase epsilon chain n=1 Tax=Roseisalinus antarcticus TaxID=254357 RepID=A0A1Y5RWR2_9RHOB|nr:F0F1 ATP synthase subunit epsilon [Roseisalinus antarcticus]SLN25917.1 ATP synthase epsilon chain [Roseisalinus antarcticus]
MKLRIVTPLTVVVEQDIDSLRAEDASGGFGVLPGHAPFLTALAVSIVSWREGPRERFCAVRGGVMTVADDLVAIASREAVAGDDLALLDRDVLTRFQAEDDAARVENVEALRLQMTAVRRMITRLRPGFDAGEFR